MRNAGLVWAMTMVILCTACAASLGAVTYRHQNVKLTIPTRVTSRHLVAIHGQLLGGTKKKGVRVYLEERRSSAWVRVAQARVGKRRFDLHWVAPANREFALLRVRLWQRGKLIAYSRLRRVQVVQARHSGAEPAPITMPELRPLPPDALPQEAPPLEVSPPEPTPPSTKFPLPGGEGTISDGGAIELSVGELTVQAPEGAIAAGESLSVTNGEAGWYAAEGPPSIAGGRYFIGSSQGEPDKPVRVTMTYDPTALEPGSSPLIIHGFDSFASWFPEETTVDDADHTVSAELDTFSPIDVVNSTVYYGGFITGNRAELPDDCGDKEPSWVTNVSLPFSKQQPLPICISQDSSESALELSLVNNRGYAQLVTIGGAEVDIKKSIWADSLEQRFELDLANALPVDSPQMVILPPGSEATLTFDKPPDQPASRDVYIDPKPKDGASSFAAVAWSILATARDEIGEPVELVDCMMSAITPAFTGTASVGEGLNAIRHCASAVSDYKGVAKKAFQKLAYGLTVDDFFYKLQDLEADEVFPASIGFTILGTGTVNDGIHISPLELGVLPAGQQTVRQLSASGGAEPYEFRISGNSANAGEVPSWVTLSKGGRLTVDPPSGTQRAVKFGVYVFDANRQHDPFDREVLKFRVGTAGGIWAWGQGEEAELGTATPANEPSPVDIDGLTDVVEITGGAETAYALRSDGTVWAWGSNESGELGNGLVNEGCDPNYPSTAWGSSCGDPTPSQVEGLSDVEAIAAGYYTAYALRADGTVWSWGAGSNGARAGDPTSGTPTQMAGLSDIKAIAAGRGTAYALSSDGTVWAWGEEGEGQLGIGFEVVGPNHIVQLPGCGLFGPCYSSTPQRVIGINEVTAIAAGSDDGYALRSDGTVWAWGDDRWDEIGNGGITTGNYDSGCDCFYPAPTKVEGLSGVDAIEAGRLTAFALVDGRVWAWGDNTSGQLGNGTVAVGACGYGEGQYCDSGVPGEVPGLTEIDSIAAGGGYGGQYSHVLALGRDGRVWAWGSDTSGQTGALPAWAQGNPQVVPGLPAVASIGAGGATSYAIAAAP